MVLGIVSCRQLGTADGWAAWRSVVLRASVNKSSNKGKRTRPARFNLRPFSNCARYACFRGRGWVYIIGVVGGFYYSLCAIVGPFVWLLRHGTKKPATKGGRGVCGVVISRYRWRAGICVLFRRIWRSWGLTCNIRRRLNLPTLCRIRRPPPSSRVVQCSQGRRILFVLCLA